MSTRTNVRDRIHAYMIDYQATNGRPPTYRETSAACRISSTSVVAHHLRLLAAEGRVRRLGGFRGWLALAPDGEQPAVKADGGILSRFFAP